MWVGSIDHIVVFGEKDRGLSDGLDDFELVPISTETAVLVFLLEDDAFEQNVLMRGEFGLVDA